MFEALRGFKDKTGHCRVPSDYRMNPKLGVWVTNQRSKSDRLDEGRSRRLDAIGFEWDSDEAVWKEMFSALALFKSQHGHCDVPQKWRQNKKLATWISTQRQRKKRGKLSVIRVKRLEDIGVTWSPAQTEWEKGFNCLLGYRREHGNCNVPAKWHENPLLYRSA
jgi:hypothetical protein